MAEQLTNLVLRLAENPSALNEFSTDPERFLKESGLSEEEKNIILSRDPIKIREAIAADIQSGGPLAATEWVIVLVNVQTKLVDINPKFRSFSDIVKRIK